MGGGRGSLLINSWKIAKPVPNNSGIFIVNVKQKTSVIMSKCVTTAAGTSRYALVPCDIYILCDISQKFSSHCSEVPRKSESFLQICVVSSDVSYF